MAGVAIGLALLVVAISAVAVLVKSGSSTVSVMSLEKGECVRVDLPFRSAELTAVVKVPCDGDHAAEVLHVGVLNPAQDQPYPPDELNLFLEVLAACVKPPGPGEISPFEARTGQTYSATSPEVVPVAPDLRTWNERQGKFLCLMLTGAGTSRV
jgi:hypothetical protein